MSSVIHMIAEELVCILPRMLYRICLKLIWKNVLHQANPNNEICYNYDCEGGYMNMVCVEVSNLDNI